MAKPWSVHGLSWWELAKQTSRKSWDDEIFGESARLAFYFFFAMFPLLLLLLILLSLVHAGPAWSGAVLDSLHQILPPDASGLVGVTVRQIQTRATVGVGAIVAAVSAAWGTLNGMWSLVIGLNAAYEVEETRPWWRVLFIALGLTACLSLLSLVALAAMHLGAKVAPHPFNVVFGALRNAAKWVVILTLLLVSLAVLYRFAPNRKDRQWQSSVPGAVVAVALWVAFTLLLRLYQEHASSSQRIYGGLNAVAILLLWLYLTAASIFIGGKLNCRIQIAGSRHAGWQPCPLHGQ